MVTETFRGCTVSCTHCSRSEAKRWGSSARSQASCREQLRAEGAGAGRGGGGQRGTPTLRALLSRAVVTRTRGSPPPVPRTPSFMGGAGRAITQPVKQLSNALPRRDPEVLKREP